jgi:hypothetical protein
VDALLVARAAVRARIAAAGRDPDEVTMVAVTKGFPLAVAQTAVAAGCLDLGENYAAELLAKATLLAPAGPIPRWHYLGAVQRRKVRDLAPVVGLWHTVARMVEGEAIASAAPGAAVLVQVELTGLPGRNGVAPDAVAGLVGSLRRLDLDVRGLMAVGPPGPPERSRPAFRLVAAMARDLGLPELSLGMSGDLEVAVEEGSTMVRVGTALFGDRPTGAL